MVYRAVLKECRLSVSSWSASILLQLLICHRKGLMHLSGTMSFVVATKEVPPDDLALVAIGAYSYSPQHIFACFQKLLPEAPWVAQSVKRLTGSGHDLTVHELEPRVRLCADSSEPGVCFGFCVSSLSAPLHSLSLSLPLSKIKKTLTTTTTKKKHQNCCLRVWPPA